MSDESLDDVIASLIDAEEEAPTPEEQATVTANSDLSDSAQLTARAARQVEKIRTNEDLDEELYLRIAVEGGGCSGLSYKLGFDYKTEDDREIESQGITIIIDRKHISYLEGITIDYPDGLDARGFTFQNPQATETCGCGTSFAT